MTLPGHPGPPLGGPPQEPLGARGAATTTAPPEHKRPLYNRLLRLQHVHPNGWQRAVLGEGALVVGVLLALADLASAWTVVVLPAAVAALVKAHDLLQGRLEQRH